MKVGVIALAVLGGFTVGRSEAATNSCLAAMSLLSTMSTECGATFSRPIHIREDWTGTGLCTNAHFRSLRRVIEEEWIAVFPRVLDQSTNEVERLVLIAAGAATNEVDYLSRMDVMSDLVLSNRLSTFELCYFDNRCSDENKFAGSALLRRYDEPAVSNLIIKVRSAGGFQDGVEDIFSGEAKRLFEDAVYDGAL